MPVAESGNGTSRNAILLAVAAFASVIGLVLLLTQISRSASSTDAGFSSGAYFQAGNAIDLAKTIESDGPIPLPDVAGGSRDIILNHVGNTATSGWKAFAARPDDVGRHCVAIWDNSSNHFQLQSQDPSIAEPCPNETYPPDGIGLNQLPVTIDNEVVVVDINAAERASTTSETT